MDLLKIAIKASIKASIKVLEVYKKDFDIEYKDDDSPLTEADIISNDVIKKYLIKTGIPILSEEGKEVDFKFRKNWNKLWIVDPIDGTKEFIKKNDEFTVNIAYVENQVPLIGVVVAPALRLMYYSDYKTGSFKCSNLKFDYFDYDFIIKNSLKLPQKKTNDIFTIVASRSHMSEETQNYISSMREKHGKVNLISRGSSLKLCMVAEGSANVYPRFAPTMEWDTAAGQAICENAGFKVVDLNTKKRMLYNRKKLLNNWFLVSNKS